MPATDDLRAIDSACDAIMRPGVAGTHAEHDIVYGGTSRRTGRCLRACGNPGPSLPKGPCHVPPLRWASAEPGSDEADLLAGRMRRRLVERLGGIRIAEIEGGMVAIRYGMRTFVYFRATYNEALARVVIASEEVNRG